MKSQRFVEPANIVYILLSKTVVISRVINQYEAIFYSQTTQIFLIFLSSSLLSCNSIVGNDKINTGG